MAIMSAIWRCQYLDPPARGKVKTARTQLARFHPPMEIIVLVLDDALLAAVPARRDLLDGGS
jgi:hypothetical protein